MQPNTHYFLQQGRTLNKALFCAGFLCLSVGWPAKALGEDPPAKPASPSNVADLSGADSASSILLHQTILGQALEKQDVFAFRIEMMKLLQDSTPDFFRTIHALKSNGDDIVNLSHDMWVQLSKAKKWSEKEHRMFAILVEIKYLMRVLWPTFNKENQKGETMKAIATATQNEPILNWLKPYEPLIIDLPYEVSLKSHISKDIWGHIPTKKLDNHPVIKALVNQDPKAFLKALEQLSQGPVQDLLMVLRSETSQGDTLWTLVASQQNHQEEWVKGLTLLSDRILLPSIQKIVTFNKEEFLKPQKKEGYPPAIKIAEWGTFFATASMALLLENSHFMVALSTSVGVGAFVAVNYCKYVFRKKNPQLFAKNKRD